MATGELIFVIVALLLLHYFADFIFQNQDTRVEKWNSEKKLSMHVLTYTFILTLGTAITVLCVQPDLSILKYNLIYFAAITYTAHFLIDWITSAVSHDYFEDKNFWAGMNVVGFDQILHIAQLLITYLLIF